MKIPYSIMEYKEANVDIEGIIKDMKSRKIQEDFILDDFFMNSDYYLNKYSNIEPDGEVLDDALEDLADEVSKHFGA